MSTDHENIRLWRDGGGTARATITQLSRGGRSMCTFSNIEFDCYDGEVIARITLETDDTHALMIEFQHLTGRQDLGEALRSRLCGVLSRQMQAAKKAAYDLGFKEGRSTRRKHPRPLTDFYGNLNPRGRHP